MSFLKGLSYVVAIVGGLAAATIYGLKVRNESIEMTRTEIVRAWTNEGDVTSTETLFITLELETQMAT